MDRLELLRAFGRVLLFLGIALCAVMAIGKGLRLIGAPSVLPVALPAGLLLAHWLMLRLVDRSGWDTVFLGRTAARPAPIAFGLALGALAIGVPTAILLFARQFGIEQATPGSWLAATAQTTLFLLPAALWEELLFRGYPFAVLREAIGWKWTLIISSLLFGMIHIPNNGADPEAIAIVITAGFFLGMICLATRSFYAAWAAHFAWNWVMACAYQVNVSGNPFQHPDYQLVPLGPSWLTGGPWGPEGGIGAAVGLFVGVFYVYGRYLQPGTKRPALQSE